MNRPRAAAAAEVFWSGGSIANGTRDVGEALPRLHDWRRVLSAVSFEIAH